MMRRRLSSNEMTGHGHDGNESNMVGSKESSAIGKLATIREMHGAQLAKHTTLEHVPWCGPELYSASF